MSGARDTNVGPEGLEPSTNRLKGDCSTIELQSRKIKSVGNYI